MEKDSVSPVREDPHSLAPVQVETIDADIARLRRGKGTRVFFTLLCGGLCAFGALRWMQSIDGSQAYAAAAERLDAIGSQPGYALVRCLLPDLQQSQLESRSALHTALEVASERAEKAYAEQLARCAPLSAELRLQLDELQVPADMYQDVQALRGAAGLLNHALASYRGYLQDPGRGYDYVHATPLIERISIAWTAYEEQRSRISQALRDHP